MRYRRIGVICVTEHPELGFFIIIKSGNYYHLYAHLNTLPKLEGTIVEQGSVIAISGKSATNDKPHLHYEVKYQNGSENYNQMEFRNPEDSFPLIMTITVIFKNFVINYDINFSHSGINFNNEY